jgi:chemotaxis family two-component system response regulator PixH
MLRKLLAGSKIEAQGFGEGYKFLELQPLPADPLEQMPGAQRLRFIARATHRAMAGWRRVQSEEDWVRIVAEARAQYEAGGFLLERLGAERYLDPRLMATLLNLRHNLARVLEARDAREALAYVDTTPGLDAIITDLSMPEMDGVELARTVRRQPSRQGLPVIALTGFPERYIDTSAFDAFVKKPFDLDELCRPVRALTTTHDGRP